LALAIAILAFAMAFALVLALSAAICSQSYFGKVATITFGLPVSNSSSISATASMVLVFGGKVTVTVSGNG